MKEPGRCEATLCQAAASGAGGRRAQGRASDRWFCVLRDALAVFVLVVGLSQSPPLPGVTRPSVLSGNLVSGIQGVGRATALSVAVACDFVPVEAGCRRGHGAT